MEQFKISRALSLSFKSWFRNFIPFTVLAVVLYSPVVVWLMRLDPLAESSADDLLNNFFTYPVYLTIATSMLVPPLLTYKVIQELNGTTVSMWTSIKFGLRGVIPAIILAVLVNVVQLVPSVGGILGSIVTCIYFVATPAAVAERLGPFAALSRSAELTNGRRWGIFGLTFLLGLMLIGMLLIWIVPLLQDDFEEIARSLRSSVIACTAVLGLFQMINGIVEAVSYALLRQDKDGVSHADLAKIFE